MAFAATLGVALFGVSALVDRETKRRAEGMYSGRNTTDRAALTQVEPTKEGNTRPVMRSKRESDTVLERKFDGFLPSGGHSNYQVQKRKTIFIPKQEREMLPISGLGNVKQTAPLLSNLAVLDRNPQTAMRKGPVGVGSATGVNDPNSIWAIDSINELEKDKVHNTGRWLTPYDTTMPITRAFEQPQFHWPQTLRRAPTFLEPRKFDQNDCVLTRPVKSLPGVSQACRPPSNHACDPKRDKTNMTDKGVMYPPRMDKGFASAVELLVDDKEDHVLGGRNPGVTRTPDHGSFVRGSVFSQWRRKLDDLNNRCFSVPGEKYGVQSHPSRLFSVYRRKQDTVGARAMVGASVAGKSYEHPRVHEASTRSSKQPDLYSVANVRERLPGNWHDRYTKPGSRHVHDLQSNREESKHRSDYTCKQAAG